MVAIVEKAGIEDFVRAVEARYRGATAIAPAVYPVRSAAPAGVLAW